MTDYSNVPPDSRRVPLENRIQLKFDRFSGFVSEYTANLSPSGVFIRSKDPKPAGTVLEFEFRLGDGFELIRGRGEVIWNRKVDEGPSRPAGMGVRFLELSPGSRELIFRLVDDHVQRGGTPFDVSKGPVSAEPAAAPPPADPFAEMNAGLPPLDDLLFEDLHGAPVSRPQAPARPEPVPAVIPPEEPIASPALGAPAQVISFPSPLAAVPRAVEPEEASAPSLRGAAAPLTLSAPEIPPAYDLWSPPAPASEAPVPVPLAGYGPSAPAKAARRRRPSLVFVILLAAFPLLGLVGFIYWDRLAPLAGLQDAEEPDIPPPALPVAPSPAAVPETTTPPVEQPAGPPPGPPAEPSPAVAAPLPEKVEPAPAGPPVTVLEKITWEELPEGTDIILWGDGVFRHGGYSQVRVGGAPPREVVRINGAVRPFRFPRLAVGTPEVKQVRIGFHQRPAGNELHVVLDLTGDAVAVVGVEERGSQLRLQVRRR